MAFDWDNFLDLITQRTVVPVLGSDLLRLTHEGVETSYPALLAGKLGERLGVVSPASPDLGRLITNELKRGRPRIDITRALFAAHQELRSTVAIPEPLRQLAEIADFPLLLTTTTDTFLTRALTETRGAPRVLSATLNTRPDLPAGWESDPSPVVYHLFGQITATLGYALTEEDTLEFLHHLHDPDLRPKLLFDLLRGRHLLFLGNSFPDWLARVFYRVLRGRRVSDDGETIEALADECVRAGRDHALVLFLRDFARSALLFEEGGAAEFVAELHARWKGTRQSAGPIMQGSYEAEDMRPGAIFISYRSLDRAAALAFADALEKGGLEVWLDRRRLEAGDPFEAKIRRHIQQCDLFVPLISRHTEAADESFFRREWSWAMKRAEAMHGRRFILPVLIDDLDRGALRGVPEDFLELHIAAARNGVPAPELIGEFVAAIRQLRTRKVA